MLARFFCELKPSKQPKAPASLLPLLLRATLVIACFHTAASAQTPPAPVIFENVPRPDTVPVIEQNQLPPGAVGAPTKDRDIEYNAPSSNTPSTSSTLYRVEISGDSPLLLAQVRKIEPQAFVRPGEGIIQAGVYSKESSAQQRLQELELLGIRAQITTISAGTPTYAKPASSKFYFVVIPEGKANLAEIEAQLIGLGLSQEAVRPREQPRGSHVAVGPFANRNEAERWNNYIRSFGMDARVYYGR
ncbi:MAG: hypothetical protein KME08_07870 [Aphanothece sp. CMT-3BRIN-NPC111]|nr:hypothetical protein [Aphanothece sp. CMT-3BRIN-NPC111]